MITLKAGEMTVQSLINSLRNEFDKDDKIVISAQLFIKRKEE